MDLSFLFLWLAMLMPLLGALVLAFRPAWSTAACGRFAFVWVLANGIIHLFSGRIAGELPFAWIGSDEVVWRFANDGLSYLFIMLTHVVVMISIATSRQLKMGGRAYFALILVIQTALFGVFTARHFIPWFLCWEMTLIPSYLLIRMWGGQGAPKAALRFFMMTLGGSAFMLVGFLALQLIVGSMDFDVLSQKAAARELAAAVGGGITGLGLDGKSLLLVIASAVFLGLAVKLPVVPFHAWLPSAYAEAPTPVTMLLTGLLSKMGVYGLLRIFLPTFTEVLPVMSPWLAGLAVATVLLGAVAALAQRDLKRMLAYSSVNHLGYCALAIAAVAGMSGSRDFLSSAIAGTILQAINHGIIATGLFYGISILEVRSGGGRGLDDFGGLRSKVPVFCGLYGLTLFASLGLPGLSGFFGEFLIFNGSFALKPVATVLSVPGLLLTAVFLLRMIRKVFAGPLNPAWKAMPDLNTGERLVFAVLVTLIVLPGVWPQFLLESANAGIVPLLDLISPTP